MSQLRDRYNRRVDYLRLSLTDRCNLRCVYCMPPSGVPLVPSQQILRYEELLRLVTLFLRFGVSKIRLTGGEPLVRRGVVDFIRNLAVLPGVRDLCLTTNGILLAGYAASLKAAGLGRVNVSLDTLDPAKFRTITRGGRLEEVLEGLQAAHVARLRPVKVNVVALKGSTDEELEDFVAFACEHPYEVRFIEYMPIGNPTGQGDPRFLSAEEILVRLRQRFRLEPLPEGEGQGVGPARVFSVDGGVGRIGVISPISRHFCEGCNRLRVTADGYLKTCLFASPEVHLKPLFDQGLSDDEMAVVIQAALQCKPRGHPWQSSGSAESRRRADGRPMSSIGG